MRFSGRDAKPWGTIARTAAVAMPASPKRLGQPVAELCSETVYVVARMQTNATGSAALDLDAKPERGILFHTLQNILFRVRERVGIRHSVAQVNPDVAIVGCLSERGSIFYVPGTE